MAFQNQAEKNQAEKGLTFNVLHAFPHFIAQHPHFRDEKTGAQRGEAPYSQSHRG